MSTPNKIINYEELAQAIADNWRTSAFSALYYRKRIDRATRWGRIVDTLIALGSGSSAGGFLAAKEWAPWLWILLGFLATLVAILRPIWFRFDQIIDRSAGPWRAWRDLEEDYLALTQQLKKLGPTPELLRIEVTLADRFVKAGKQDPPDVDETLLKSCQAPINQLLPTSEFWSPKVHSSPDLAPKQRVSLDSKRTAVDGPLKPTSSIDSDAEDEAAADVEASVDESRKAVVLQPPKPWDKV